MPIDTEAVSTQVEDGLSNLTAAGWNGALKMIIMAIVLLIICLIVKRVLLSVLDRGLDRGAVEKSFHAFIRSAVNILLWFITIMIVAQSLGVNATSLIALLSIVGLAVSLSVQDSLANLASGITILVTRPFKVGDFVDIGGELGTVMEIGMIHTKLTTLDNRRIFLPNSTVVGSKVENYAVETQRRVDLTVCTTYEASIDEVKQAILEIAASHSKVLKDPEPFVRMSDYKDSGMEFTIRLWCLNEDYWDVHFDVLEQIQETFNRKGIEFPYPHMDVRTIS